MRYATMVGDIEVVQDKRESRHACYVYAGRHGVCYSILLCHRRSKPPCTTHIQERQPRGRFRIHGQTVTLLSATPSPLAIHHHVLQIPLHSHMRPHVLRRRHDMLAGDSMRNLLCRASAEVVPVQFLHRSARAEESTRSEQFLRLGHRDGDGNGEGDGGEGVRRVWHPAVVGAEVVAEAAKSDGLKETAPNKACLKRRIEKSRVAEFEPMQDRAGRRGQSIVHVSTPASPSNTSSPTPPFSTTILIIFATTPLLTPPLGGRHTVCP